MPLSCVDVHLISTPVVIDAVRTIHSVQTIRRRKLAIHLQMTCIRTTHRQSGSRRQNTEVALVFIYLHWRQVIHCSSFWRVDLAGDAVDASTENTKETIQKSGVADSRVLIIRTRTGETHNDPFDELDDITLILRNNSTDKYCLRKLG